MESPGVARLPTPRSLWHNTRTVSLLSYATVTVGAGRATERHVHDAERGPWKKERGPLCAVEGAGRHSWWRLVALVVRVVASRQQPQGGWKKS